MLCRKCHKDLATVEFHKRPDTKTGLHTICKNCKSFYDSLRKNRKSSHKYISKEKHKWEKKNPYKTRIQKRFQAAVRRGKIKKGCCAECGSDIVHGHHYNYDLPFDVIWLCPLHHSRKHH